MPPFGYAVCLVNGKKRDGNVFQYIQEIRHGKTFRRYVEQFYLITLQHLVKVRHFLIIQRTIHISRGYSVCPRSVNLVFHQGDKRADDNSGAAHYLCRKLIAERLSAACGHYGKNILLIQNALDYLLLIRTECIKAEDGFQGVYDCRLIVHWYFYRPFWEGQPPIDLSPKVLIGESIGGCLSLRGFPPLPPLEGDKDHTVCATVITIYIKIPLLKQCLPASGYFLI